MEAALIDQRMRADRHKLNFDALKVQHLTLQERFQTVKSESDLVTENYDRLHQKSHEIIQKLQNERDDKVIECEELKKHALTGLRLEQLRLQLADEIEEPFRKRTETAEAELENLRSAHNKLKYSYSLVKSECDTAQSNHQSLMEELSAKYNMELTALVEERKSLLARQDRDIPSEMQRIRLLERENGELRQRVKSLLTENEEVQAEKELVHEHNQQDHQLQSRTLAELHALNQTLELERSSLASQTQALQVDLSKSYQQQQALSEEMSQTQRQLTNCTRKLEETGYRHTMQSSEVEMKHLEQCRELQQDRDHCLSSHMMCQAQVQALTKALQEHDTLLADKEQQIEQRVQVAREKEWEKQVILEREKVELEERIAEQERMRGSAVEDCQLKIDKLEVAVSLVNSEKSQLESQLDIVSTKLQDKSDQLQPLLSEVQQLSKISRKYHTLSAEHRSLQQSELKLREAGKGLEETVCHLEGELFKTRQEMAQTQENWKQSMELERQSWLEEKRVLTDRIDECQARQVAVSQKLAESRKEAKKLQRHYRKQLQERKHAAILQAAEMDKLGMEKAAKVTALNLENQKLKGQLADAQRKRKEFLFILQNNPHSMTTEVWQRRNGEGEGGSRRDCDKDDLYDIELTQQNALLSELTQQNALLSTVGGGGYVSQQHLSSETSLSAGEL